MQHDTLTALSVTSLSMGVGLGLASTALMIAVQTSVAWDQRGIATASTMFSRTIGGALAVGAMGGVLNASLEKDLTIPRDAASRVLSQEGLQALPPVLVERLSKTLADGLGAVFWIVAGLSVPRTTVRVRRWMTQSGYAVHWRDDRATVLRKIASARAAHDGSTPSE